MAWDKEWRGPYPRASSPNGACTGMRDSGNVVLVADLGRSGQGWMSYMLCYALNAAFVEPYDFLRGAVYSGSDQVMDLTRGGLPGRAPTRYSMVVKTHEYPGPDVDLPAKVILMIRDPRDVAVSAYYRNQALRGDARWKPSLKTRFFQFITRSRFINLLVTYRRWIRFVRAWKPVPHYLVRYEDLRGDTVGTLRGVLEVLGESVPEQLVEEAVELFSFSKLSGREPGKEDVANPEFRKGIVGDHTNHFSDLELKLFAWLAGKDSKETGYDLAR